MIVLGSAEPRWDTKRVIRKETLAISDLVHGVTSDSPYVMITVPSESVMVTIANSPSLPTRLVDIYYECLVKPEVDGESDELTAKIELHSIRPGDLIDPLLRLLGHFWYLDSLIALYAKDVSV